MSDDTASKPEDKKITAIQGRIITAAAEIATNTEPLIEYQHGLFCQLSLPRSRPQGRVYERHYQHGSIRIEAGALYDGKRWVDQPLPSGPKPRLALIHINSEAVRTRCPEVEVERSAIKFMEKLGLNVDGGSSYTLFKRELKALSASRFQLGYESNGNPTTLNTQPIRRFEAWMTAANDPVFWPGVIELSREYFDDLLKHAVPLDGRAIRALSYSAMALDAYSFLARRLHTLKKPIRVTWQQFHEQFGQEYMGKRAPLEFKKRWMEGVRAALAVYPDAKVEQVTGGLTLYPSFPPVHRSSVAVSIGLADHVQRTLAPPTRTKHLKPATVEQFCTLYPRLDVYACQEDFDAWLEGKGKQAHHYDKAFLGFAKVWIKGKI